MDVGINRIFYFQAQFPEQSGIPRMLFEYRINDDGIL